jgi:hypothetical protein
MMQMRMSRGQALRNDMVLKRREAGSRYMSRISVINAVVNVVM